MTIKGSLQMSIPLLRAFWREILSRQKWPKICVWGWNGIGHPKGTSLRETTSFDILIVKIGAGVLAVDW